MPVSDAGMTGWVYGFSVAVACGYPAHGPSVVSRACQDAAMESSKIVEALWDRMQARDWEGLGRFVWITSAGRGCR